MSKPRHAKSSSSFGNKKLSNDTFEQSFCGLWFFIHNMKFKKYKADYLTFLCLLRRPTVRTVL